MPTLLIDLAPIELLKNASQTAVLMSPENSSTKASDKSQQRSKSAAPRVSTISAASQIIRNRGFMTLFTGFRLHLLRDMIGGGVYFGVYESCKQALGSFYGNDMKNTPWAIPLAGAICGISSWVVVSILLPMRNRANRFTDLSYRHHENQSSEPAPRSTTAKRSIECRRRRHGQKQQMERPRDGHHSNGHSEHDTDDGL